MPRKAMLGRESILTAAIKIARRGGLEAVTARSLSSALGCSLSPLFTVFESMDEIRKETREYARRSFIKYVDGVMETDEPFKEYGMQIIRFASHEPELFNIIFLSPDLFDEEMDPVLLASIEPIKRAYSLTDSQAMFVFHRVWIFVCGLAVLNSSRAEHFDEEQIGSLLFEQFHAVLSLLRQEEL